MLDQDTKRRIDTARDILVGKLPNPQAQVEQITIAMIYKFMDDMDKEAMEFGGEATFFTGEFEKYSWTKIFDPKLGGFEMLALYGEAIAKLNQNPSIPQLFRDIFKNAFLPYRDPETLKMFLKIINEFHYDHSEKLGDAFEYLLSVLGSQGDAGQFRTPRHIIDFMVAIMQPKKEESICDPACGTAGFLISAYKHILNENTNKNKGDLLTPDDRKKLINNFVGYDISAEMVRLSLVNLYLHGFTTPKIYEYDTLTSEDRWGDYFDIILANPPFMTPKGGIRPHKKFAMQANRSEVLFVDYIMEHINPTTGRAGIIVPEGIIFQSATAYKSLRKLLIDKNYLFGVISLPAGVFQPYSGVKTSILLIDKSLAKKTDKILFVKLENDGFSLGSQRKELQTSEIPDAINFLKSYQTALRNDDLTSLDLENLPLQSLLVEKNKISSSDDYNLAADRYRLSNSNHKAKYELVSLGDVCTFIGGYAFKSTETADEKKEGYLPIVKIGNLNKEGHLNLEDAQYYYFEEHHSKYLIKKDDILMAMTGATVGKVAISDKDNILLNQRVGLIRANETLINKEFLKALLLSEKFYEYCQYTAGGGAQGNISPTEIMNYKFPLPELSIQEHLTKNIQEFNNIISGSKQIISNYNAQFVIDENWELIPIDDLATFVQGINTAIDKLNYVESGIKVLQANNIYLGSVNFDNLKYITEEEFDTINDKYKPNQKDVLYSNIGARFGYASNIEFEDKFTFSWNVLRLIIKDESKLNKYYFKYALNSPSIREKVLSMASTSTMPFISGKDLKQIKIPIPPIEIQEKIAAQLEYEKMLIDKAYELISIFSVKKNSIIENLWDN